MKRHIDAPRDIDIPALRRLWQEAFGDSDAFLDTFFGTAYSPARCRCVTVDGDIAAALYWFDCTHADRRIAYLYAVATAKAYRGQGLCHALMTDTHRHLTEQGYAGVILSPGSDSLYGFYGSMGYRVCTFVREFTCHAAPASDGASVRLRPLDISAYAALRRRYLPADSVLQEGESLTFLHTMATCYEGDGFLMAARTEGKGLRCVELLGDPSAAEHIVRTLGCETGFFRTPGTEIPLTVFLPLREQVPAPAYFGLPFD